MQKRPSAPTATSFRDNRYLQRITIFAVAAATALGLTLWLASSVSARTSADKASSLTNGATTATTNSALRATRVTVAAGSPSEFRFKLSKLTVPPGVVTFVVRNTGHIPHDFKIAGKRTKLLQPGKSQTLKVTFAKPGPYRFLCTVTGHAAAGMKGTLNVMSSSAQRATRVTVAAGSPSEFRFKLSKLTVPTGVVTFVVRNTGHIPHDFKIAGKRTKLLQPGKSQTLKVTFAKPGPYKFLCTVTGHAAAGMKGTLRVR